MSLDVTVVGGERAREARGLGRWVAAAAPKSARGEVVVAIVADARMRALNRQFRGKDQLTDVLSIPGSAPILGEIVLAAGLARRQARVLGHRFGIELRILALHGLLHLLGYDHEVDNGQMARAEARLRRRAGLPAGLIARST